MSIVSLKLQNIYEKIGGYSNIWKTGALAGSFEFHPFLYFWLSQEQYVYLVALFTIFQTIIPILLHEWGNVWNAETKQTKHIFFFKIFQNHVLRVEDYQNPKKSEQFTVGFLNLQNVKQSKDSKQLEIQNYICSHNNAKWIELYWKSSLVIWKFIVLF